MAGRVLRVAGGGVQFRDMGHGGGMVAGMVARARGCCDQSTRKKKSALIFRPICPDFPPLFKSAQISPPSAGNVSVQIVLVTNLPGKIKSAWFLPLRGMHNIEL